MEMKDAENWKQRVELKVKCIDDSDVCSKSEWDKRRFCVPVECVAILECPNQKRTCCCSNDKDHHQHMHFHQTVSIYEQLQRNCDRLSTSHNTKQQNKNNNN